jgi:alpha-ketoglutarate-dependent taurine dioxygenase
MSQTNTLTIEKVTPTCGAEVIGVTVDQLLNDEDMPQAVMEAVEEHGALLFRNLNIDDASQAAFFSRLGEVVQFPGYEIPEVMVISLDPDNPNSEYLRANVEWHIDGTQDPKPAKASVLTARRISPVGGETEFVSTYAAYDELSDEEKQRFDDLKVWHSFATIQKKIYSDPTPEQIEEWERRGGKEIPLVWTHESGRKSLVLGATASHIIGMDEADGAALLADLLERATQPERVFSHTWSVGDTAMWDNTGTLHRAMPFDPASRRAMHRTTIVGQEAIQ